MSYSINSVRENSKKPLTFVLDANLQAKQYKCCRMLFTNTNSIESPFPTVWKSVCFGTVKGPRFVPGWMTLKSTQEISGTAQVICNMEADPCRPAKLPDDVGVTVCCGLILSLDILSTEADLWAHWHITSCSAPAEKRFVARFHAVWTLKTYQLLT